MKIPIFMIFRFFGVISTWAEKALEDGKITAVEGFGLVLALASILGVQTDFNVSDYMPVDDIITPDEIDLHPDMEDVEPKTPVKPEE